MDQDMVGKVADASKAIAEAGGKALDQTAGFTKILEGPFRKFIGKYEDNLDYRRWINRVRLIEKAQNLMAEKGMSRLSREILLKFGVRLIDSASLEEDEDLRETWARLLVNAGDSSTEIDLRTAYIEILAGMSAFDVKNLSEMAKASLSAFEKDYLSVIETWNLPHSAKVHDGHSRKYDPIPKSSASRLLTSADSDAQLRRTDLMVLRSFL